MILKWFVTISCFKVYGFLNFWNFSQAIYCLSFPWPLRGARHAKEWLKQQLIVLKWNWRRIELETGQFRSEYNDVMLKGDSKRLRMVWIKQKKVEPRPESLSWESHNCAKHFRQVQMMVLVLAAKSGYFYQTCFDDLAYFCHFDELWSSARELGAFSEVFLQHARKSLSVLTAACDARQQKNHLMSSKYFFHRDLTSHDVAILFLFS